MKIETKAGGGFAPIITAKLILEEGEAVEYQFSRIGYSDLKLTHYAHLTKEGSQRKWRRTTMWDRHDKRNNKISEPPFPAADVCDAVLAEYFKLIKVTA